ncbi:E3 ubiquitin-protein ligase TRIM71-like isoform X1 [Montipora foliosa]|uniref:E3 ubiquitin-protein ligase TRIM71-like isoform X1 n=2 Tax=Montipora foliosa TaxID=591990 RepID=UPI0035F1494F
MACSKNFFDDIKKELECSVCQEQFSEANEPKILKCLHTFCKNCLEGWLRQHRNGDLSCPTCRHITHCDNNDINKLPSNLFCKQLVEIVEAYSGQLEKEDSPHCGICDRRIALKFYCAECNCFLCDDSACSHVKGKVFEGHSVKEISRFKSNDVQDLARRANICKKHNDELRYYCDKCKVCICRDCALLEHRDHKFISFDQGLDQKKSEITKRMEEVEAVGCHLQEQKEILEKRRIGVDHSFDQATIQVNRFAEHCISLIRRHEEAMSKELLKAKESFENEFSSQMTSLSGKLTDINSSLEFGRDILERNNLPEILNVEETLERRFEDFLSSSEFNRPIEMNVCAVKYVGNNLSMLEKELGKIIFSNTDPSMSIALGKGLLEGLQGNDCTFMIITKDWLGETTYSETDKVEIDIQSLRTGEVIKPRICDSKDGCYEVKYKLDDAGEFSVSVAIGGEKIRGSPFHLKVEEIAKEKKNEESNRRRKDNKKDFENAIEEATKCAVCMQNETTINRECSRCSASYFACQSCLHSTFGMSGMAVCPFCPSLDGHRGNQPPGHMIWRIDSENALPGHGHTGTFIISCNFDRGIQDTSHPNPGVPYYCYFCMFYLPNTFEGFSLCVRLRRAFNSQSMFTVGDGNNIVSNFELKMRRTGGPGCNGYPDRGYLHRLDMQLLEKGFQP